jgi:hypothetical protein
MLQKENVNSETVRQAGRQAWLILLYLKQECAINGNTVRIKIPNNCPTA